MSIFAYRRLLESASERKKSPRWRLLAKIISAIEYLQGHGLGDYPVLKLRAWKVSTDKGLEKFAAEIVAHLGLKGKPVITWGQFKKAHVYACIVLGGRRDKIEIFVNSQKRGRDVVLRSALAHEFTHKLLEVRGLNAKDEALTDICSIVAGMGKYILNGVYYESSAYYTSEGCFKDTIKLGYLPREIYGFIYQYVALSRGLSYRETFSSLNAMAFGNFSALDVYELVAFKLLRPDLSIMGYLLARFYWQYKWKLCLFAAIAAFVLWIASA